jgi:hypothetical protein
MILCFSVNIQQAKVLERGYDAPASLAARIDRNYSRGAATSQPVLNHFSLVSTQLHLL